MNKLSPESLAYASARHPWRTVFIWIAAIVAGVVLIGTLLPTATTTEANFTNDPDSIVALDLIEERFEPIHIDEVAVVRSERFTVDDPEFETLVQQYTTAVGELGEDVIHHAAGRPVIADFYMTGIDLFVSADRHTTIVTMTLADGLAEASKNVRKVISVGEEMSESGEFEILLGGPASIGADFEDIAKTDLLIGELIGVGIALLILLVVFRAGGSAWIPVVIAIISITLAIAMVAVIGQAYKMSFFVTNIITMIGLAVGIDYSLFIIARVREERAKGLSKVDAIGKAGSTATRAVVFSGVTVVFALLGMVIVPTSIFFSIGLGAMLVVVTAVLAALTLVPAILSLLDNRINSLRVPFMSPPADNAGEAVTGFWAYMTRLVMNYPWPALIIAGGLLIAATIPYFSIQTGSAGVESLPDSFKAKKAFLTLQREFPAMLGGVSAADILVDGDAGSEEVRAGIDRLKASLEGNSFYDLEGLEYIVNEAGNTGRLKVTMPVDSATREAVDAIDVLREVTIPAANVPADLYVGGQAAGNLDFFDLADRWTPIVIAFVLVLTFIFLMGVFRSIIVPIKAVILNLLSVGAAYGLLVLVLQKGVGNEIFGFQQVETIEAWLPVFLFSILFGLSMDYEVFLLSRIRERYDQTRSNLDSVAFGLKSTGSIITGAALIMVAVFGGFAIGDLVMFQQMGFGLGVAILVDATIIRAVLVPATMRLLGDLNWYLPGFLNWMPDLRVEASEDAPAAPTAQEALAD